MSFGREFRGRKTIFFSLGEKVYGKKMINGSTILVVQVQGSHFRSVNQTKSLFFNREKALEWLKLKSAYMGKKLCSVLDSR